MFFPEVSTMTCVSCISLHGVTHSFIELDKAVIHVISLVSFLWLWFAFYLPLIRLRGLWKLWRETDCGVPKNSKERLKKAFLTNGVITHLEPDILECEVKWALESITMNKASGGDGIPAELFQILKDDAVKVLHSIYQQIWKTQQWPQDWKRSVFIPIPKKSNAKECSNYCTIALISHTSKVMFKIP